MCIVHCNSIKSIFIIETDCPVSSWAEINWVICGHLNDVLDDENFYHLVSSQILQIYITFAILLLAWKAMKTNDSSYPAFSVKQNTDWLESFFFIIIMLWNVFPLANWWRCWSFTKQLKNSNEKVCSESRQFGVPVFTNLNSPYKKPEFLGMAQLFGTHLIKTVLEEISIVEFKAIKWRGKWKQTKNKNENKSKEKSILIIYFIYYLE